MESATHKLVVLLLVSLLHHPHVIFPLLVIESRSDVYALAFVVASFLGHFQGVWIQLWLELRLRMLSLLLCLHLGPRRIRSRPLVLLDQDSTLRDRHRIVETAGCIQEFFLVETHA